jgi:predicted nucleic acid-binding protein
LNLKYLLDTNIVSEPLRPKAQAGIIRRHLFADGQIAAIAAVNELTLVTNNEADFRRFQGLRAVSWR